MWKELQQWQRENGERARDGVANRRADINEQGGGYNLVALNCPAFGINVDATVFSSIPAQNYTFRDVEIFPGVFGSGTTIGMHLKGNGGGVPGEIRNITSNGASGHVILASVQAENWNEGNFHNVHGEFAINVWLHTSAVCRAS